MYIMGVQWVEMGQNNDLLQNSSLKRDTNLDQPTLGGSGTQSFKGIANLNMCFLFSMPLL